MNENKNLINETPIRKVMIYPYSARITRIQKIKLNKDINKIFIQDLPQSLYRESVKADIINKDDAIVKSINLKIFHEKKITREELQKVKEELKNLYREKNYIQNEMERLNDSFLKLSLTPMTPTNTTSGSNNTNQPMPLFPKSWESYLNYLKNLLTQNRTEHRKLLLESIELEKQIKQKNKEEQTLSSYFSYRSYGAEVILASNTEGEAELQLSYIVPNASWFPVYDLRVDYEEKTATLTTYGIIQQKTGEDWQNVLLSLSTASPTFSTDTVKLNSWRIRQKDTEIIKQVNNTSALQLNAKMDYEKQIMDKSEDIVYRKAKSNKKAFGGIRQRKSIGMTEERKDASGALSQDEIEHLLSNIGSDSPIPSDDDISPMAREKSLLQPKKKIRPTNIDLISKQEVMQNLSQHENIAQEQTIIKHINQQNVMPQNDYMTTKQKLQNIIKSKNLEQIEQSVQNKYHTMLKNNILDTFSYDNGLTEVLKRKSNHNYKRQDVLKISGGYDYRYSSINPETIPSQHNTIKVTLKLHTQPVELTYQTIPLISSNVYLKANYKNESDAPLLAGQVRVFIDADFMGDSFIDTVSANEYASFSLGTDNDIKVIRREKSKKETSGVFNKSFIIKYDIEIELMNYKNEDARIEVLDRIPQARHQEEISIFDESFSITPDKKTYRNILKWVLTLKPQEKKSIKFSYKIKHPEEYRLSMHNDNTPYKEGEK